MDDSINARSSSTKDDWITRITNDNLPNYEEYWATRREIVMGRTPAPARKRTKSLAQHAEEALLHQLRNALVQDNLTAIYCCGGKIPIYEAPDSNPDVVMSQDTAEAGSLHHNSEDSRSSTSSSIGSDSEVTLRLHHSQ
jgi:hypothetical protein